MVSRKTTKNALMAKFYQRLQAAIKGASVAAPCHSELEVIGVIDCGLSSHFLRLLPTVDKAELLESPRKISRAVTFVLDILCLAGQMRLLVGRSPETKVRNAEAEKASLLKDVNHVG